MAKVSSPIHVEEVGGLRVADRGIPGWLITVAVSLLSVAMWYLLSYSSADYNGGYPKPELELQQPGGGSAPGH